MVPSLRTSVPFLSELLTLLEIRLLFAYDKGVPERWCTVTVTDEQGRRYSLDVEASSTYDVAHLYVAHTKTNPAACFPTLTLATVFEVVASGRVYQVRGAALQRWIAAAAGS